MRPAGALLLRDIIIQTMKKICVYCGSSNGKNPAYKDVARQLGLEFAKRKLSLVYGGAGIGLMGAIADAVLEQGGEVIGVIPQVLVDKEVAHKRLTELKIVDSMHARKALMADLADGFIALPGGLGTLEELFEILTWAQLGLHQKPCALFNVEHYYDALIAFLNNTVEEQFVKNSHRSMLLVGDSPSAIIDQLMSYQAPVTDRWLGKENI